MNLSDQAREHVKTLLEHPVHSIVSISRASGVHRTTVRDLIRGTVTVRPATAKRLLAVTTARPADALPADLVLADPARDHLRAIHKLGYTHGQIAEMTGTKVGSVGAIIRGKQDRVKLATYDRILATPFPERATDPATREYAKDPEAVRTHLHHLRRGGHRWTEIAAATGICDTTVGAIARGKEKPTKRTATAILGHNPPPKPKKLKPAPKRRSIGSDVIPWGILRRDVIKLHRAGRSESEIATALNLPPSRVRDALLSIGGPRVRAASWPPAGHMAPRPTRGRAA